jgi:hypothetical protein
MSMSVISTVWTPPPRFTYAPEHEGLTLETYPQSSLPGDEETQEPSTITVEEIITLIYGIPTTITVSSVETQAPDNDVASLNAKYAGVVPGMPKRIIPHPPSVETSRNLSDSTATVKSAALVPRGTYETFHSEPVPQTQTSTPQTQTTFLWPTKNTHAPRHHSHFHFHTLGHRHGAYRTLQTHAFRTLPTRAAAPYSHFLTPEQMAQERDMDLNETYTTGSDVLSRLGEALPYPNVAFMVFIFASIALGFAWASLVYHVNFPDAWIFWVPRSRQDTKKDGGKIGRAGACTWWPWPLSILERGKEYTKIGTKGKKAKSDKPIDKPSKYIPIPLSSTSTLSSTSSGSYESATPSATSTATPTYPSFRGHGTSVNGESGIELRSRNRKRSNRYVAPPSPGREDLHDSPTPMHSSAATALPNMTASALGIRESDEQQLPTPELPSTAPVPGAEGSSFPVRTTSVEGRSSIEHDLTPPPAPTITLHVHDHNQNTKSSCRTKPQDPFSSPENPYLPHPSSSSSLDRNINIRTSEEWLSARAAFSDGRRTPMGGGSAGSLAASANVNGNANANADYRDRYTGSSNNQGHANSLDIEAQDPHGSNSGRPSKRSSWLTFGPASSDDSARVTSYDGGNGYGNGNGNGNGNGVGYGNGNGNGWLNKVDDAVTGLVGKVARWTENADGEQGLLLPVSKGDRLE